MLRRIISVAVKRVALHSLRMKSGNQRLTQRVDLWLLACLEALVEELSVTRAAERLGTTQPAMSNSLARLRAVLGDPILVKSAQGLAATRRAQALVRDTTAQRRSIESALNRSIPFDPSTSHNRVVLSMMDPHSTFVLPPLFGRVAEQAMHLEIVTRLPDHTRIRQWLENGACDIAIGYFPDLPTDLRSTLLYVDSVSVVSRADPQRDTAPMTLQQYLEQRHLMISAPFAPLTTLETVLDRTLKARGLERTSAGLIPSFSLAFFVVSTTPLLISMPTEYARYFSRILPLRLDPLPVAGIDVQILMIWHERTHLDPAQQWMRAAIREIITTLNLGRRSRKPAQRHSTANTANSQSRKSSSSV